MLLAGDFTTLGDVTVAGNCGFTLPSVDCVFVSIGTPGPVQLKFSKDVKEDHDLIEIPAHHNVMIQGIAFNGPAPSTDSDINVGGVQIGTGSTVNISP